MGNAYKIAVIGAGDRGRAYSNAWSKMDNVELVAVCDILQERADNFMQEFGYKAKYLHYREAIDKADADIVTVCTPAYLHPEISIYAMRRGKHVISEKPMALSLAVAGDMIKTAQDNNVQLAMGFQYHNIGGFRKIKHAIDDGLLGRPIMARFADIRSIRPKPAMHDAQYGNGGPMVDMLCHFTDLMRWYFQSDPVSVAAKDFTFSQDRPEIAHIEHKAPDTAAIIIQFESSDVGAVTLCWGLPPTVNGSLQCEMVGPKGLLETIEPFGNGEVRCKLDGNRVEDIPLLDPETEEIIDPQITLLKKLLKAIEGDGSPQRVGSDGYIALATSLAAIKSAAEGRSVTLREIYEEQPDVMASMGLS
ncbi:Gfo/Idh/MocA family protein [Mahella australiensis]|uniref:Oxidoreductase domain protein n=1 Tax=Mahella australiensis (strain DSM 15567 / CIP 107919 / 50-1 BON) TaxID=697281 RepID=F3ZZ62_MAHA5|nr:Gfo/Idh/MocA family oxidoreductase [Mahella australiensis]AEE97844.1 oxidoreductase domain protein [Mahella australiensis 50-1 BON]